MPKTSVKKYATWSNGRELARERAPDARRPDSARSSSAGSGAGDRRPDRGSSRGRRPRRRSGRSSAGARRPRPRRGRARSRLGEVPRCGLDADADDRELGLDASLRPRRRVRSRRPPSPWSSVTASPSTTLDARVPGRAARATLDSSGWARAAKSRSPGSITVTARPRLAQRGGGLHPDEAGADDERTGRPCGPRRWTAERVVEGAVGEDALEGPRREPRAAAASTRLRARAGRSATSSPSASATVPALGSTAGHGCASRRTSISSSS